MRFDAASKAPPPAARLPYLDVMRGLAVVIMIESHVFHSFTRLNLRNSDAYQLSQWIGGLAAPLFLFIAGIMVGFRIEGRDARGLGPLARMRDVLKRAAYIFAVAELILLQQLLFQWPRWDWNYLLRVDILNCMALAVAVSALVALAPCRRRPFLAIVLGAGIAGLAPLAAGLSWSLPAPLADYLFPKPGRFAFFPEAAYVPFGIAAGFAIRRAPTQHIEDAMRWMALIGFALLYAGEFASNQPYSLYAKSDFWVSSPALIAIRIGLIAILLAAAFLWTKIHFLIGIFRQLGTTSLLVYWVHIELVYGSWLRGIKKRLTPGEASIAFVVVIALMYGLSLAKTTWWRRVRPPVLGRPAASLRARVS